MRERINIDTDIPIIGGGTCRLPCSLGGAAGGRSRAEDHFLERAYIRHSGSLAAGQNALSAYINQGTPEDWVAYVRYDLCGAPVREDILLSVGRELTRAIMKQ